MNQEWSGDTTVAQDGTIPAQMSEPKDEAKSRWSEAAREHLSETRTILFVEDEAFVRDVTSEVLQAAGYRLLIAKNAAEAGRAYDDSGGEVELLLTDVVLPGETGRSLARRLRREHPELKALFVTGYAEHMEPQLAEGEECLAKPFSTGVLLRRVREMLEGGGRPGKTSGRIRRACGDASPARSGRVCGRAERRE